MALASLFVMQHISTSTQVHVLASTLLASSARLQRYYTCASTIEIQWSFRRPTKANTHRIGSFPGIDLDCQRLAYRLHSPSA
eukprot:3293396-Amphidinium_carterae.1